LTPPPDESDGKDDSSLMLMGLGWTGAVLEAWDDVDVEGGKGSAEYPFVDVLTMGGNGSTVETAAVLSCACWRSCAADWGCSIG
jgi:hypothetical protein